MFITMLLIPPLMRSAQRLQIVDIPDARKVHVGAIPRIGGIAMVAGAVIPILVWMTPGEEVSSLLWGMAIIFVFGIWDDRNDLDYRIKFFGQTLAVLVVVVFGNVSITSIPLLGGHEIPQYIAYPLTILFLLGITNAINLADGLDGLAGGTTLLSLGVIALLAYVEDDIQLLLISMAILGSILGFLRFNTHPARVFMGDGGSQFLGFSVGVLSLLLTQREGALLSTALPLLILALPILDTTMVMVYRIREGRSPFSADKNHIHHRLLALGLTHYEAVFVIYIAQSLLVLAAYSLRYYSDALILVVFVAFCAGVMAFFRYTTITGWRLCRATVSSSENIVGTTLKWLHVGTEGKITHWAAILAFLLLTLYFTVITLTVSMVSIDLGILAAALCVVQIIWLTLYRNRSFSWLERGCIYILCAVVGYLSSDTPAMFISNTPLELVFFMVLTMTVVLGFRFSMDRAFKVNTLDFLVIFSVFAVPNLPGQLLSVTYVGELLAKLIVLFYAIELILTQGKQDWRVTILRMEMVAVAGWIGFRGIVSG